MELTGIQESIQLARVRWPSLETQIKTDNEACAPCPFCGGEDRFVLFDNGYWFCRPGPGHCGRSGWIDDDKQHQWTPEERRLRKIEAEQARARRERQALDTRLSAIERLNASNVHEVYYNNLDSDAYNWWIAQGVELYTIHDYRLGYCPRCPTDRDGRASYTIPLWDYEHRQLLNIRHRLANADNGDKYRPQMAGLGTCLAFSHHLDGAEYGVIVEGAKKALVAHQYGFPTVGVMGKRGRFKVEWLDWFPNGPIYVALDPDATESAEKLGAGIAKTGKQVRVAHFPMKPDDMFLAGCTGDEWEHYLKLARRVN